MRLDEWQKYIGAQFLDDETEAVPASKPAAQTVSPFPAFLPSEAAEKLPTPAASLDANPAILPNKPEPTFLESRLTEPGTMETAPSVVRAETAPNSIQNVVTMVVAPVQSPDLLAPTSRAPRIELLTPVPEQKPEQTAKNSQPEVSNRTRRRSQSNTLQAPAEVTENPVQNEVTAPFSAANPVYERNLFEPLEDINAEIPSFASYLPAAHAAAAQEAVSVPPLPLLEAASDLSVVPETRISSAPDNKDTDEKIHQEAQAERRMPRSRARHARNVRPENVPSSLSAAELWATVPRHVQTLLALERLEEEQEVAQYSYKRPFQEKRHELIERLLDPILSLEDAARLLNVCPTTVRRYTNKGILTYYRKEPERATRNAGETSSLGEKETRQRRFRLSDILTFLETQKTAIAADQQAERRASLLNADCIETNEKDS